MNQFVKPSSNSKIARRLPTGAVLVVLAFALQACTSVPPRNPVPEQLVDDAVIPGIPLSRAWGDARPVDLDARLALLRSQLRSTGNSDAFSDPYTMLSISGGGADGAFGAGLLKGWSERGTRPAFNVVTGVSTGALIAPLAFLGAPYDDELEQLYTTLSTADVVERRSLLSGLNSDALGDTAPLRKRIEQVYDRQLIEQVAVQHSRGRRLLIGTTNLDTQRPVTWSLGEIAARGDEESQQLFRDVLLASAAIPGMFPPVRIRVSADGQTYDELHVDGGISSQVFLYPASVDLRNMADLVGVTGQLTVYVIRNGRLSARWSAIEPELWPIVGTSMRAIIRSQGIGDLYRIFVAARRDGLQFRLAYVPDDFDAQAQETFDAGYMRKLFDRAYQMALPGYPWLSAPPELISP